MLSNKYSKKLYRYLSFALQDGIEKLGLNSDNDGFVKVDQLIEKSHCNPSLEDIKEFSNNHQDKFELVAKGDYYYIRRVTDKIDLSITKTECITYNAQENIQENNENNLYISKELRYVNGEEDILKLSPIYILNVEQDKINDICDGKEFDFDDKIILYPHLKKGMEGYVHIYLEWAHAYCKGVQFVINDDNTLTVADSDIHILFDYIWKIITWEGKELC